MIYKFDHAFDKQTSIFQRIFSSSSASRYSADKAHFILINTVLKLIAVSDKLKQSLPIPDLPNRPYAIPLIKPAKFEIYLVSNTSGQFFVIIN